MKKKQRCLLKRFAALVAALMLCFSISSPALAAFDDVFDLPSQDEFNKHPRQWYIEKLGNYIYFFPLSFHISSSGASAGAGTATSPFSVTFTTSSSASFNFYYLNAFQPKWLINRYPVPIGAGCAFLGFVPTSKSLSAISANSGGVRYFVADSSDLPVGSQGRFGSELKSGAVSGPIYRIPAYYQQHISNNHTSGMISGPSTYITADDNSAFHALNEFYSLSFYAGDFEFTVPYSSSKIIYSNHLVYASALFRSVSDNFLTSDTLPHALILRMSVSTFETLYGSGYSSGSWFPSDEDLQNDLVNQFGVDSNTLKNSKDSLNSWNSTSSVDSDVASGASGLLGGLFQNLGTFLFSVSLLCFGAVVLRMLIRKAVDG